MNRRTFLTLSGVALTATVAGCLGEDSQDAFQSTFESSIEGQEEDGDLDHDLSLDSTSWDGDVFVVDYFANVNDEEEIEETMGPIGGAASGAYTAHEPDIDRIDATLLDPDDESTVGTYEIQADWIRQFADDEISASEYEGMMMETWE